MKNVAPSWRFPPQLHFRTASFKTSPSLSSSFPLCSVFAPPVFPPPSSLPPLRFPSFSTLIPAFSLPCAPFSPFRPDYVQSPLYALLILPCRSLSSLPRFPPPSAHVLPLVLVQLSPLRLRAALRASARFSHRSVNPLPFSHPLRLFPLPSVYIPLRFPSL